MSKTDFRSGEKIMPAMLWGRFIGKRVALFAIFATGLVGCYKDHLYVQIEKIDRDFLASTHIGTPDPRQLNPPEGKRLLVAWRFPSNLVDQGIWLELTVRFWDQSQEHICRKIEKGHDYASFNFFDKRLLTYKIEVVNEKRECIDVWEHQFWTDLIDVDKSNVSVSSQPMQGSVIETPY
jgi:hypothetical protein